LSARELTAFALLAAARHFDELIEFSWRTESMRRFQKILVAVDTRRDEHRHRFDR
jgi:hypothetical protein